MTDKIRISNNAANVDIWADENTTISLVDTYDDDEYAEITSSDLASILQNATKWEQSKVNVNIQKLEKDLREMRFKLKEKDNKIKTLLDTIKIKEDAE